MLLFIAGLVIGIVVIFGVLMLAALHMSRQTQEERRSAISNAFISDSIPRR
jgi:uncharacterized membrane protein